MDRRFFEENENDYEEKEDSKNFQDGEVEVEEEYYYENNDRDDKLSCNEEYSDLDEDLTSKDECKYNNQYFENDENSSCDTNNCGFTVECYSTFEDQENESKRKNSFLIGKKEGYKEGYEKGYDDGAKEAIKKAYKAGFKSGLKASRFRR